MPKKQVEKKAGKSSERWSRDHPAGVLGASGHVSRVRFVRAQLGVLAQRHAEDARDVEAVVVEHCKPHDGAADERLHGERAKEERLERDFLVTADLVHEDVSRDDRKYC